MGKRSNWLEALAILAFLAALFAWLWCVRWSARGAPAPVWRAEQPLRERDLVGVWEARWWTVSCVMHLDEGGAYRCDWCGVVFWGLWGLKDGLLHIKEDTDPWARSWAHYRVRLDRRTLSGPFVDGDGRNQEVTLTFCRRVR